MTPECRQWAVGKHRVPALTLPHLPEPPPWPKPPQNKPKQPFAPVSPFQQSPPGAQ